MTDLSMAQTAGLEMESLQTKIDRLELVIDISKQFSATLNVNTLMKNMLDKVADVLDAEACSFWMKDQHTNEVVCHVAVGPVRDEITNMRLTSGTGIVGWVIEKKQRTVVFDTSKDERFYNEIDKKTDFLTKSILCVPLIVNQECVGAISLLNKKSEDGLFGQEDLEMLEMLAMSGAIAIKNAQLFQSERRVRELNTLLTISQEITSTLDLDGVLISVVNLASQVIHYKRALIGLLDLGDNISLAAESNKPQPDKADPSNKQLLGIMNYVIDSGTDLIVTNYAPKGSQHDNLPDIVRDYLNQHKLYCISVFILKDSEGNLGLLSMEGTYSSLVVEDSAYVLPMVVNLAGVAIRNAQLYRAMPTPGWLKSIKKGWFRQGRPFTFILIFLLLLASTLASVNFKAPARVTADLEVVPSHQTRVTAKVDGVVREVLFHEGEMVDQDQVLVNLDTILELERAKFLKDRSMAISSLRQLESDGQPHEIALKGLEIERLDNQILLLDRKIEWTEVKATDSGRVLTARPEDMGNMQVVKGEVLAEIARNDEKAARLIIREHDIMEIRPGATVRLTLQAIPDLIIQGEIESVSPAPEKTATENPISQTIYLARLTSTELNQNPMVRFGMTGKAKILIGHKTLYDMYLKPIIEKYLTLVRMFFEK